MFKKILEDIRNEKLINAVKKLDFDTFINLIKRGQLVGKTISDMTTYIDNNSQGQLDLKAIRNELAAAGETGNFFLYEVDTKKLKIQDKSIVDKENTERDIKGEIQPIVVGKDYFVIDGRHRASSIKGKIPAYLPAELFYKEVNS